MALDTPLRGGAPPPDRAGGAPAVLRFLLRRLAAGVLTLVALSVVVFTATEVLPGDAAGVLLGQTATPEKIERVRAELGLDRPAPERYLDWASGMLTGDMGESFVGKRPVSDIVADRLPNSLLVGGLALALLVPLAVGLGLLAGLRAGRPADRGVSLVSLLFLSVPEFVTASLLIGVFAISLDWLPAVSLTRVGGSPLDAPDTLVLPVASLLLVGVAYTTRYVRATVLDVRATAYVEAARLNGVPGPRLVLGHILPNALAPTAQLVGLLAGALAGGSVVVETIFTYPGIGATLQQAVASRDLPLVQGIAITLAAIALAALIAADLLVVLLTPRLRTGLR